MKYDFIEEKVKDLVRDLQWAERDACCEDDYDRLTDIAEDIIGGIPRNLLLIDYWTRYGFVARLPERLRHNTEYINKMIEYLYKHDTVYFGDATTFAVDEDIEKFLEINDGLQEQTKD